MKQKVRIYLIQALLRYSKITKNHQQVIAKFTHAELRAINSIETDTRTLLQHSDMPLMCRI